MIREGVRVETECRKRRSASGEGVRVEKDAGSEGV